MGKVSTYIYDSQANKVHRQSTLMQWDVFFCSTDKNLFRVTDNDDGSMTISGTNGESMSLQGVTEEQIVILFAAVRGMKEAARE